MEEGEKMMSGLTLTVLGCGTLGTAILSGLLSSISDPKSRRSSPTVLSLDRDSPPESGSLDELPTRFIACVRRTQTADGIAKALAVHADSLTILRNENLRGAQVADVVLLGCPPSGARDVLGAPGMGDALRGKLLISILAGVSAEQIRGILYGPGVDGNSDTDDSQCQIVRAMPNTAAFIQESMTLITAPTSTMTPSMLNLTTWIFSCIGPIAYIPSSSMDACTALCGSGPAFFAMMLEAIVDGAVAMGVRRTDAQVMAAYTMRGTAGLVLAGEHPAVVREKVTTPGGSTIKGCMLMEEGRVRWTMANVLREATVAASRLGDTT
ncbi:MAG: delta 1-pyrroline-5-carboxylate reductase [Lichina confinis]|nr:MAG: delta 1-pyrroline-5-carboxylate reductase [Lichina confinis]